MGENFNLFIETVDERFRDFVEQINEYLTEKGCKCDIKNQLLLLGTVFIFWFIGRHYKRALVREEAYV